MSVNRGILIRLSSHS